VAQTYKEEATEDAKKAAGEQLGGLVNGSTIS
jgi:hypothetical protein